MKMIILGAGQVGASLAENLVTESHDITVVDENPARLNELQERLDTIKEASGDDSELEDWNQQSSIRKFRLKRALD